MSRRRRRLLNLSASGNWFEAPEFDDYAIVLDFENNRYAMPALDGSDAPILTRVEGVFPKRAVTFADAMAVSRYDLGQAGTYPSTLWRTYQNGEWSLIGGDGIGTNVPRLERWLGRQAMWVQPDNRFNRMPFSMDRTTYPVDVTLARAFAPGYRVSWVGTDDLTYTVVGHEAESPWSGVIAATSTTDDGLNWGVIPYISAGFGDEVTSIGRAGNPGTSFAYVNLDTHTNNFRPATSMIRTDDHEDVNGNFHVERSPEHVRVSAAIASIIGRGDSYPRAGTFVIETHQTQEPVDAWTRSILGGNPEGGSLFGRSFIAFTESGGAYRVSSESPFGDLHLTLADVSQTTEHIRIALAFNGNNNLRRLTATGAGSVASDTGNPGFITVPHFGMPIPASYTGDQIAGEISGTGAYYKFLWSPDVFEEAEMTAAVAL